MSSAIAATSLSLSTPLLVATSASVWPPARAIVGVHAERCGTPRRAARRCAESSVSGRDARRCGAGRRILVHTRDTADEAGLPGAFRVVLDPGTLAPAGGAVLLGGTPFRLVRLAPAEAAAVRRWQTGEPVGDDPADRALARALITANLAQPVPPAWPAAPAPAAPVTVVVPVRDDVAVLPRLLAALHDTPAVRRPWWSTTARATRGGGGGRRHGRRSLLTRPLSGGPGAARNDGAAVAGTPFVAFVDADCVPAPGWLEALLPHFADPRVAVVAPRVGAAGGDGSLLARYEAVRAPHDRGPAAARVVPGGRVPFLPGAAMVVRAAALGAGFDPSLRGGEDVDLVWRLAAAGFDVRYEPAARVAHAHRAAPRDWLARRAFYGAAAAPLARKHPGAARPLALSPWSAAAWLAVGLGRPVTGVGMTAVAAGLLARELRASVPGAAALAGRLAGLGTLWSGRVVADALLRSGGRSRSPGRCARPPAPRHGGRRARRPAARLARAAAADRPAALDRPAAARRRRVRLGRLARLPARADARSARPDLSWRMRSCTGAELVRAGRPPARGQTVR